MAEDVTIDPTYVDSVDPSMVQNLEAYVSDLLFPKPNVTPTGKHIDYVDLSGVLKNTEKSASDVIDTATASVAGRTFYVKDAAVVNTGNDVRMNFNDLSKGSVVLADEERHVYVDDDFGFEDGDRPPNWEGGMNGELFPAGDPLGNYGKTGRALAGKSKIDELLKTHRYVGSAFNTYTESGDKTATVNVDSISKLNRYAVLNWIKPDGSYTNPDFMNYVFGNQEGVVGDGIIRLDYDSFVDTGTLYGRFGGISDLIHFYETLVEPEPEKPEPTPEPEKPEPEKPEPTPEPEKPEPTPEPEKPEPTPEPEKPEPTPEPEKPAQSKVESVKSSVAKSDSNGKQLPNTGTSGSGVLGLLGVVNILGLFGFKKRK